MEYEIIQNKKCFLINKNYLDNIFVNLEECRGSHVVQEKSKFIQVGDFKINYKTPNLIKKKLFKLLKNKSY